MRPRKSQRHVRAANARWSHAQALAQVERDAGIPDRTDCDIRQPITLDLRSAGGPNLTLEPRIGYVAWRARDSDTGQVMRCAALKELLHRIADELPRRLSDRAGS